MKFDTPSRTSITGRKLRFDVHTTPSEFDIFHPSRMRRVFSSGV